MKNQSVLLYGSRNSLVCCLVVLLIFSSPAKPGGMVSNRPSIENVKNLRIYPNPLSATLAEKSVTFIHRDIFDRFWIGTQTGLYIYEGQKISSFSPKNKGQLFIPALDVTGISEDAQGGIWISTYSSGISKYEEINKRFERAEFSPRRGVSFLSSLEDSLLLYKEDKVLTAVNTRLSKPLKWLHSAQESLGIKRISRVYKISNNQFFALTDIGLLKIDFSSKSIDNVSISDGKNPLSTKEKMYKSLEALFAIGVRTQTSSSSSNYPTLQTGLGEASIITDIETFKGLVFVATDNGLFVFDKDLNYQTTFNVSNSSLSNNHITQLLVDEDTLWIATYEGICFLLNSEFQTFNNVSTIINDEVLSFSEDHASNIWIGTYNGLYRVEKDTGNHVNVVDLFPEFSLPDIRIMSIQSIGEDLWIGTRNSGVHILNLVTGELAKHNIPLNNDLEVTSIHHITNKKTLVGSYNNGLYLLNLIENKSEEKIYTAERLIGTKVTLIYPLVDGKSILIGTENQIFSYELASKIVSELHIDFGLNEITPVITAIHQTADGRYWIGTQSHGIYLASSLGLSNSRINLVPMFEGTALSTSAIYAIEVDNDFRTWISGSDGIFLIRPDGHFARRFTTLDGLQGNKFNFGASLKDSDGHLFFGGSRGYNRFNPKNIVANVPAPNISVRKVSIAGYNLDILRSPTNLQSIILSHTDHFITFEFSALELIDPQSTRYRHKLVGFDPEWIDIDNRRSATYTNLPPGQFEFRVQAVNAAGVWNREGISINLEMKPAPWRTWWAYTLYGLFIAILIFAWHRLYRAYAIKNEALVHAKKMQDIADRYADDLQEQIEFQGKLSDSFHFYNKDLLACAREGINTSLTFSLAGGDLTGERLKRRLQVLDLLQDSLYYHGEQLYANLNTFTNQLANYLEQCYGEVARRVTVINGIPNDVMPASHAVSCAIIIAECLDNSLAHAFPATKASCFVRLALTTTTLPPEQADRIELSYQDDGVGLRAASDFDAPESGGMTMIASAVASLNGKIGFSESARNTLLVTFQIPWARKSGSSLIGEETGKLDN